MRKRLLGETSGTAPRAAARAAAAVAVVAGVTPLVGWIFDVAVLRGLAASVAEAKPTTALGFVLAGASLWLLVPGALGARRRAGQALGAIAALIGAGSFAGYLVGRDLGIGALPFGAPSVAADTANSGVPETALGLVLLGLALATLDTERPRRQALTEVFLLLVGTLGFFSLVAFAYGSPPSRSALAPMLPQTALLLLVLCAGVFCASPGYRARRAMRGDAGALITRRLLPIVIVVMPVLGWLRLAGQRADLYPPVSGVALFVAVVVAMLAVGIVRTARLLDRAQAESQEQQQRLQAIVDNTTSVIVLKDVHQGRFLLANRPFEQLVRRPREEILGLSDHDLFPPEVADAFREHDRRAVDAGRPVEFEETVMRDDGPHTYVSVRFPLLDTRGEPYAVGGVKTDITDRKQAEEVASKAQRKAERADQAKSEFLSRMSHELRTPLNSIIGFGQLLEMDGLDETQAEYVERILKGGRHLLDLINEVLDISRIEAGTLGLSLEPVDAHAAIDEALGLIRPMAAARGLRVYPPAAPPTPAYVTADQQRLKQVFLNLLSNAVKYNRDGGAITVSLQETAERLRFMVADTGAGLTNEQVQRLFVPFDRLGVEGHEIEGTGLGLALSKRLAEAMGGTLEVESERGVGTTFFLELPRVQEPGPGVELSAAGRRDPSEGTDDSGTKVLYIEDNLSNLRLVEEILSHRPELKLIAAMQGSLGLDLAERHRPDLIILDLHLPDMPGSDVLARLQSEPATRAIPVVVLSADATSSQIQRLLEAGAIAYLTKPLDVRRFLKVIDEHVGPSTTRAGDEKEKEEPWMPRR